MRINFQNGILDFFFPIKKKIRIECKSSFDPKTNRASYEFFTFRAFASHYWHELFYNRHKEMMAFWRLQPQLGAIAFDAASNSGAQTNTNNWTWSHTCTGSNLVLAASVGFWNNSGAVTLSGVTYNTVGLTSQLDKLNGTAEATVLTLASPATGAHDVVVTFSANSYGGAGVISFSGANTSSVLDATAFKNNTSGTSVSQTITTNNANSMIVDALCTTNAKNTIATTGANQTSEFALESGNTQTNAGSYMTTTGAGNYVPGWQNFANATIAYVIMAINEAASASTFIPQITIL